MIEYLIPHIGELIVFLGCLIVGYAAYTAHDNAKRISSDLYAKLYEIDTLGDKKPSPFRAVYRHHSSEKVWGYTISRNGHEITSNYKVEFFRTADEVQKKINELERLGNYVKSEFNE